MPKSINASRQYTATPEEVERYACDGVVVLRGILTPDEVHDLRDSVEWNLKNPGPLAGTASRADDPGRFFEDFCSWHRVPGYGRLIFSSALPAVAAQLMRSRTARLFHDHLLVKEGGTRQPTPFHQDQPYYNVEGRQNVSFWIPVDHVPRESTLEFVPGSHEGTWYMPRTFLTEQAKWFPEGSLSEPPPLPGATDQEYWGGGNGVSNDAVKGWALEPGDAVAFHMLTLHGSAGSSSLRRAFSVRMLGDDARHAPRPWKTSPEFPGLSNSLPRDVPMEHPLFPLVHTEQGAAADGAKTPDWKAASEAAENYYAMAGA
jgi:ectoine hydroxylase-related dioxygenase (phytanoyl-CoA dioxygenase family)